MSLATSCGVDSRCDGVRAANVASRSLASCHRRSVSVKPAAITLTSTPSRPASQARLRARPCRADLACRRGQGREALLGGGSRVLQDPVDRGADRCGSLKVQRNDQGLAAGGLHPLRASAPARLFRYEMATRAPSDPKAAAAPMPEEAPVTSTTRSLRVVAAGDALLGSETTRLLVRPGGSDR